MSHRLDCAGGAWPEAWADVLRLAWLRDQDSAPLVRALRGGEPPFQEVLTALCRREFIPELVREMRRAVRRAPPTSGGG